MKLMITLGVLVFSTVGGLLGTVMDKGNGFGGWAILLTIVGSFVGIWAGYKIGKNYF